MYLRPALDSIAFSRLPVDFYMKVKATSRRKLIAECLEANACVTDVQKRFSADSST